MAYRLMNTGLQSAEPLWDSATESLSFTCPDGEVARFRVSVEAGGKILSPSAWEVSSEGGALGLCEGFEIRIGFRLVPGQGRSFSAFASVTNRTGGATTLGSFRFRSAGTLLASSGSDLRIYKEGWTMTTPATSVRYGDKDSFLNPGYKAFSSPAPPEQDSETPNRFFAEYAVVLNSLRTSENMLVGFISSGSQVARFVLELNPGTPLAMDAISEGDGIVFGPGECLESEELIVLSGPDAHVLLETFAGLWGARMSAVTWGHTPTGWCSWPYYFEKITEADMLENASWLRDHGKEFPVEYVQMDDGYQADLGDWLTCDENKFPNGLECLAKEIRAAGFKPGIWLAPFLVAEQSQIYATHPDWTVKNQAGETVWVMEDWRGSRVAVLDATQSGVCEWFTELFATLAAYGYEYVKLDFLAHEAGVFSMGGRYADPKATRIHAVRRGLQAMRDGLGKDKFILACTSVLGAGVGIVNACRIGTDFLPAWNFGSEPFKEAPTLPNVLRNVINRKYMDRRLWINDPDAYLARIDNNKLTGDEVRMFAAALWITGGMVLAGDRFSTLTGERGDLSKMLLNDLDAFDQVRPLDLFEEEYPSIWVGRSRKAHGQLVIGTFNFDDASKILQIDLRKAGLPHNQITSVREFWSQQDLGEIKDSFQTELKPHSSKVFFLSRPTNWSALPLP